MKQSAEELIIRLYESRKALSESKTAVSAYMRSRDTEDICEWKTSDIPPCYYGERGDAAEWCETCRGRQPLWEDRKQKSAEAGKALRAVLRMGKILSAAKTQSETPVLAEQNDGMRSLTAEERKTITDFFWSHFDKVDLKGMVMGMVEDDEFRNAFPKICKEGETPKPAVGWSGEPK